MSVKSMFSSIMEGANKKSPAILTGFAVAGLITTAYLTYKAGRKIERVMDKNEEKLRNARNEEEEKEITKETVKEVGMAVAAPVIIGTATAACIIGSNTISAKRISVLSAAYSVSAAAARDLNAKMEEVVGEKKAKVIKDMVSKDKLKKHEQQNPGSHNTIIIGDGDVRCYDSYLDKYFSSNMQKIKETIVELSGDCGYEMYVSLNDFYTRLGLKRIPAGEDLGWGVDDMVRHQLPITISSIIAEDGVPCLCIDYEVGPRPDFRNLH